MQNACAASVICGLSDSTTLFHINLLKARFSGGGGKDYLTKNLCPDFLYKVCQKHFHFLRRIQRHITHQCTGLHVKYPSFLSDFNKTNFLGSFSKKIHIQIPNFMKIHPVVAELSHTDIQT
jgi:hypothetical protein